MVRQVAEGMGVGFYWKILCEVLGVLTDSGEVIKWRCQGWRVGGFHCFQGLFWKTQETLDYGQLVSTYVFEKLEGCPNSTPITCFFNQGTQGPQGTLGPLCHEATSALG